MYLSHCPYQFVAELAFPVLRCDDVGLWYVGGVSMRESGPPAEASFSLMFVGPPSLALTARKFWRTIYVSKGSFKGFVFSVVDSALVVGLRLT